jgi:transposase
MSQPPALRRLNSSRFHRLSDVVPEHVGFIRATLEAERCQRQLSPRRHRMKLHGNAALSWSGRRVLARRVVVEGWTLTAAAEAAGVSVRCARKWAGRYRQAGEEGLFDRSSAPRRAANRTPVNRVEAIVRLRKLRFTAAEIAETLGMAVSTVSGILTRCGMGRLGRSGLSRPSAMSARGRASSRTSTSKSWAGSRAGPAGASARARSTTPDVHRQPRQKAQHRRLGVRPHRDRRLQPPRLRRGARRRESGHDRRLPAPRGRLLQPLRHPGRAAAQRQRRRPPLDEPRRRLPSAWHPPPAHTPLPANKRESRTLHPHAPRRLGVRRDLPAQAANAPPHLTAGSGTTTINDDIQQSAANPRSPEPTCSGPTFRTLEWVLVLEFGGGIASNAATGVVVCEVRQWVLGRDREPLDATWGSCAGGETAVVSTRACMGV